MDIIRQALELISKQLHSLRDLIVINKRITIENAKRLEIVERKIEEINTRLDKEEGVGQVIVNDAIYKYDSN